MKSAGGIGNASVLQNHGIETLVDLPGVGEQFQEHLFVAAQWQLQPGIETFGAYTPFLHAFSLRPELGLTATPDALRNNATFAAEQAAQ